MKARTALLLLAAALPAFPPTGVGAQSPDATYWVYVGAESADLLHRIRFGPEGASVEKTIPIGEYATEVEGPHGLAVSRDGTTLYVSTAHGVPDGKLWKFAAGPDTVAAVPIHLGNFPATLDVTPDGLYAFVVNFNLHGEMIPSTVSVVFTPDMVELAQVPTCTMPHGMRVAPAGLFAYSGCMMDDQLVELDTRTFEVSRRFSVAKGSEGPLEHYHVAGVMTGRDGLTAEAAAHAGHTMHHEPTCSPTWAQPSPDGREVFVACNRANEILVVDRASWSLARRIPTGAGPYNLALTPDGRILVATLKAAGQVQFFDAATGELKATVPSSTTVTHGAVVSPDGRFAFVSVEGKGAEPGKVDVFDLSTFTLAASVEVGQQAGGIAFWKMEPARP